MIPIELNRDKDGLLYYRDDNILTKPQLALDKRANIENRYFHNGFYPIPSTDEYIIKFCYTCFTRKEIKEIKYMLDNLVNKQKNVSNVDFPIAYFALRKKLYGLIVKYYKDGIACANVFESHCIETLGKYYYHNEDSIHNLFMLYDELLNIVYEMFENGIYYTDLNLGNIVINDNKLKVIDFDPRYVFFNQKDERLRNVLDGYYLFIDSSLNILKLGNNSDEYYNFEETKKYLKKLENKIRRG